MTDNVDPACGSRSNPQDYEGIEDLYLNPKLRSIPKAAGLNRLNNDLHPGAKAPSASFGSRSDPKLHFKSKACRYGHGTDVEAGLKIARTGPCRYRHGPDVEAGLNLPVVSRIRTLDNKDRLIVRPPLAQALKQWFNDPYSESESEEEDSRQAAGEATMGASTARRRSEPEEQGTPSNNDDRGKCLVH